MLAFFGVWVGLASLMVALAMPLYRPAFSDFSVVAVLYFGSPGALCFAFLTLWAYRKEPDTDPGLQARRLQCRVTIAMAVIAAAIVYGLIIFSTKLGAIEG